MEESSNPAPPARVDPASGLPLPHPFAEYLSCPRCGEAEIEVFCYQSEVRCHRCGQVIAHASPPGCGIDPSCQRSAPPAAGD